MLPGGSIKPHDVLNVRSPTARPCVNAGGGNKGLLVKLPDGGPRPLNGILLGIPIGTGGVVLAREKELEESRDKRVGLGFPVLLKVSKESRDKLVGLGFPVLSARCPKTIFSNLATSKPMGSSTEEIGRSAVVAGLGAAVSDRCRAFNCAARSARSFSSWGKAECTGRSMSWLGRMQPSISRIL